MRKENIQTLLNNLVLVEKSNRFKYYGWFDKVDDTHIYVKNYLDSIIVISLSDINHIRELSQKERAYFYKKRENIGGLSK